MKLQWLSKYPTNYDMLKRALSLGTSNIPKLIRFICRGGRENVNVLEDEMFANLVTHASTLHLFSWWVSRKGIIKFDGKIVPSRNVIQIEGYWFIDNSLAEVLLAGNIQKEFDVTEEIVLDISDLEKDFGVEVRSARAREFESYNVFKRVWLAITKQVIF